MKYISVVTCALALLWFAGCSLANPSAPAVPDTTVQAMNGRFAVFQGNPRLALDTKTGLACKTWNWTNPSFKGFVPLCADLYTNEDQAVKDAQKTPATDAEMNAIIDGLNKLGKAKDQ